ncbi:XRE family transcriptional regulator [Lactiplantibacillus plantarum]|uniref:helix-turn-helix domain-containing protein n=1 Tax=Lactiplantibacillus plantarum TaxID=1590 RepID=UPI0005EF3366|nr:helix-turn-helix transcriptional regulator [Lactiplantibacillus plantarum]PKX52354.1 XRE family transcriptional regulator [Lactiplantibacillus plantarum]
MTTINKQYDQYNSIVGNAFREIRNAEGVTQQQLAARMDLDIKTISRIETGKNALTIAVIRKMSDPSVLKKESKDLLELCRLLIDEPSEHVKNNE